MYTSNFSKKGNDVNAIAISIGIPNGFKGKRCLKLAPSWDMVNEYKKTGDKEAYIRKFNIILSKLNAREIYEELGDNAIMLCYEKSGDFCHRRLVADWIRKELGITVNEI